MSDKYRVFMHRYGEILVDNDEIDADDLQRIIRDRAPAGLAESPGVTIAKAVVNGGGLAADGWAMAVQRIRAGGL